MSEFLSPKKAAKMLGVCPNTLRSWEESGKITSQKTLGGHRRYYLEEINALIKNKQLDILENYEYFRN